MIVYGDDPILTTCGDFADRLEQRLCARRDSFNLEEARNFVVLAGQLEQAASDAGHPATASCQQLTAHAAEVFWLAWRHPGGLTKASTLLSPALTLIRQIAGHSASTELEIRTPEGFSCYALYPDGYAQAAMRWAKSHPNGSRVLVIGIRSIGTTLAAVVAAALRAQGFHVDDLTVRPTGHPYARQVDLPLLPPCFDRAIVVDEGPGRSGSSMATVAEALNARGFGAGHISFFAGHRNGPGPWGDGAVRSWWTPERVHAITFDELRFGPRAAHAELADAARRHVGTGSTFPFVDDADPLCKTIANAPALQAPRLLVRDGSDSGVALVFAGFAAAHPGRDRGITTMVERRFENLVDLAQHELTALPLGHAHGWLVLPPIAGKRLQASDLNQDVLSMLAQLIRRSAGAPLPRATAISSIQRLGDMLIANARELLPAEYADVAAKAVERELSTAGLTEVPSYGDGRLSPHNFIREPDGSLTKTDAFGYTQDHTVIGRQSIAWDVAGAVHEWNLGEAAQAALLGDLGCQLNLSSIAFHRAAYAAFRAGLEHAAAPAIEQEHPAQLRSGRLLAKARWLLRQEFEGLQIALKLEPSIIGPC